MPIMCQRRSNSTVAAAHNSHYVIILMLRALGCVATWPGSSVYYLAVPAVVDPFAGDGGRGFLSLQFFDTIKKWPVPRPAISMIREV